MMPLRHAPSSRLHPPEFFGDWPMGKLYPVTAAQLLPILTGFLAPATFSKLAKNWNRGLTACASSVKTYLAPSYKSPTQCDNGAVCRECFFLLGEGLNDRVAFLSDSDHLGNVTKIIR